ncbi:hypothetical protein AcV5_002666 [Taiwanofungus camphoratus]|nr:hypothetical protein AcV5_002666 [Antrodia cinnamomea]KAI0918868.1 hypothetical protein AcV7_006980 [Antrodia cinnamomea]
MPLPLSTSPASLASVPSLASPTPPASPASVSAPAPPSPTTARKPNGRSLSTLDAGALVGEGVKDLSGPAPIVPTPIRERSPPPAFSVTSRPTLQTQFAGVQGQTPYSLQQQQHQLQAQQQQQQQHQQAQQLTVRMISSPPQLLPSPPALPAGRQPLIPNGGMPPSKGFTGGGLLASATANPTVPSNPPAPALRATAPRRRARRQTPRGRTSHRRSARSPVRAAARAHGQPCAPGQLRIWIGRDVVLRVVALTCGACATGTEGTGM